MELPFEYLQELNALKRQYYLKKDEEILTNEEVMKILRIDSPRTLANYIDNGLVCLNTRPRKFIMQDVRRFILRMRKCNEPYSISNIQLN